jgi:aromatic ring-opening dioxygenase catalytic subunit (LigB family)
VGAIGARAAAARAVLVASAHWETAVPMFTVNPKPETIHDFGGFPEELYRIRYPAAGAPELAAEAGALLKQAGITAGVNGCRGLDHGAWVPLSWMSPEAGVPVLQVSLLPGLAPDAARAHPSEEHYLPLLVAWGAAGDEARAERFAMGFEAGALANDTYLFRPATGNAH